jgi:succinate-acetate transporter protein
MEIRPNAQPFADPMPLGLLGLAVGCAALLPVAFGKALSADALRTAAVFCLMFGAGGQLLAGLLALANKNLLGGTLFTTFSFNWAMNYWALTELASGRVPNEAVILAVDACFLLVFVALTYASAFAGSLLTVLLVDLDLLYALRMARALTHAASLGLPIALCTVALGGLAMWLGLAGLVNPLAGRAVFRIPGPLLTPGPLAAATELAAPTTGSERDPTAQAA